MGCTNDGASDPSKKKKKPPTDYTGHPHWIAFNYPNQSNQPDDPRNFKKFWIEMHQVPQVLANVGCQVVSDGSAELHIMDPDYRGIIRYKEFHKYVKKWKKGALFEDSDSSYSESDCEDQVIRDEWKKLDTRHACVISKEIMELFLEEFLGEKNIEQSDLDEIIKGVDKNSDGQVTFKEFSKYFKDL